MKKIAIILLASLMLSGCAKGESAESTRVEPKDVSRFVTVEDTWHWRIVYDKETGVMYAVSLGSYNMGNFTVLVDADGNPLIYEGAEK